MLGRLDFANKITVLILGNSNWQNFGNSSAASEGPCKAKLLKADFHSVHFVARATIYDRFAVWAGVLCVVW